jgi:cell division protein FtsB
VIEGGRRKALGKGGDSRRTVKTRKDISPQVRRRRRLAVLFFILAAAGLVTYLLLGPILRNMDSRSNLVLIEDELEEERDKTRELEERKETAETNEYVENEARGMNYVKPGEIPIVVLDDEEASEEEPVFPAPQSESEPPVSE